MFRCNYIFSRDITSSFLSLSFFCLHTRPRIDSVELFNIRRCDGFISPVAAFDHDTDSIIVKSLPGIHSRRVFPLKAIFLHYEELSTYVCFIRLSIGRNISARFSHRFNKLILSDVFISEIQNKTYSDTWRMPKWTIYDFSQQILYVFIETYFAWKLYVA